MKILIPRGVRGLGALGPYPPSTMLKPGMQWVRYYQKTSTGADIPTAQASYCPSDAPWGCWMWEGYAWGQVPAIQEFRDTSSGGTVPTSSGGTATPTADQIKTRCEVAYEEWTSARAKLTSCLDSADKAKFVSLCTAVWLGKMDRDTAEATWNARVRDACREKCRDGFDRWVSAHPAKARCLPSEGRSKFVGWCLDALYKRITNTERDRRWDEYVAAQCAARRPAPDGGGGGGGTPGDAGPTGVDAPVPTEPVLEDTPDVVESPDGLPSGSGVKRGDELVHSIVKGDGMDAGAGGAGVEEKSLLRRVGPIVGIGLVLAVGGVAAWQYQMKKKGRGARRRR